MVPLQGESRPAIGETDVAPRLSSGGIWSQPLPHKETVLHDMSCCCPRKRGLFFACGESSADGSKVRNHGSRAKMSRTYTVE